MKYIRHIVLALILIGFSFEASAGDLPEEYKALGILIGDWTGSAKITMIRDDGHKVHTFDKTVVTRYDTKRKAIVMIETELNPWTGKRTVINSETRWDSHSKMFKSMVWSSDGEVRLFSIQSKNGQLEYNQIDAEVGAKFACKVRLNDDGSLIEQGSKIFTKPQAITVKWSVDYKKKKSG